MTVRMHVLGVDAKTRCEMNGKRMVSHASRRLVLIRKTIDAKQHMFHLKRTVCSDVFFYFASRLQF